MPKKKKLCVVGLDMSLTGTGVCVKIGDKIDTKTIKTTTKTASDDLARLRYIVDQVMKEIPKDVDMVCIEDFFTPMNKHQINAAIKLAMLATVTRMALYEKGIPFYVVAPTQVKKFTTGKGTSKKEIMVREVWKRWGVECSDDNQADSTALAHIAEGIAMGDDADLTAFQIETLDKIFERPNYNTK